MKFSWSMPSLLRLLIPVIRVGRLPCFLRAFKGRRWRIAAYPQPLSVVRVLWPLILGAGGWLTAQQQVGTLTMEPSDFGIRAVDSGELAYVMLTAPTSENLDFQEHPHLKEKFLRVFQELRAECPPEWPVVSLIDPCSVGTRLGEAGFLMVWEDFEIPPVSDQMPPSLPFSWPVFYNFPEPSVVDKVYLRLITEHGETPAAVPSACPTSAVSVARIREGFDLGPAFQGEDRFCVSLVWGDEDLANLAAAGIADPEARLRDNLMVTAAMILGFARDSNFLPGQTLVNQEDNQLRETILHVFSLGSDWGVQVDVNKARNTNDWQIRVSRLRTVDDVAVALGPGSMEAEVEDPAARAALARRRQNLSRLLSERYRSASLLLYAFPNKTLAEKDILWLDRLRPVRNFENWQREENRLTARVVERGRKTALVASGKFNYSVEEQLTAGLLLSYQRLLEQLRSVDLQFGIDVGDEIRKGHADFNWKYINPKSQHQWGYQLKAQYAEDDARLFGSMPRAVAPEGRASTPPLSDRGWGGHSRLDYSYDSFTVDDLLRRAVGIHEDRKRTRYVFNGRLGFEVEDVTLSPRVGSGGPEARGRLARVVADLSLSASLDLARGLPGGPSQWDIRLEFKGQNGFHALGGDFNFEQYQGALESEYFFGINHPRSFFVRDKFGIGGSSPSTPFFERFALGGERFVRGPEEGEFLGRALVFNRFDFGVRAVTFTQWLASRFRGRGPAAAGSEGAGPPGSALANTYLKVFYDLGSVADHSSVNRILDFENPVEGYGLALELRDLQVGRRRAHLTMGYARSPDSVEHKHGVWITGLAMDF